MSESKNESKKEKFPIKRALVEISAFLCDSWKVIYNKGVFYTYNKKEWIWNNISNDYVDSIINRNTEDAYEDFKWDVNIKFLNECRKKIMSYSIENTMINFNSLCIWWMTDNFDINLKNWILNFTTKEIRDYKKSDYKTYKLNIEVNKYDNKKWIGVIKDTLFEIYLNTSFWAWFDTDEWLHRMKYIQEIMGYFLMPWNPLDKMFVFSWEWWNGKWVFFRLMRLLLWEWNTKTFSYDQLHDSRGLFELKNIMLNYVWELDKKDKINSVIIKNLSWNDPVSSTPKYDRNSIEFIYPWKLLFSSNHDVFISWEFGISMDRRLMILPLNNVPKDKVILNIENRIIRECWDKVMQFALYWLESLIARWYFDVPKSYLDFTKETIGEADVVYNWLTDESSNVELAGENYDIWTQDAYKKFRSYCYDCWILASNIINRFTFGKRLGKYIKNPIKIWNEFFEISKKRWNLEWRLCWIREKQEKAMEFNYWMNNVKTN